MGRLTYNTSIFTNVNKWDDEYTYLGIFVTGKLNQRNGADYPILDVIDLDWDGAYIKNLSTYLYTTEDLINVLDMFGQDRQYLYKDVINSSYMTYMLGNIKDDYEFKIQLNNATIENRIFENLLNKYEVLEQIREVVLDDSRYIRLEHDEVFDEEDHMLYPEQEYYIYYERQYWKVDNDYVRSHPTETYYKFILRDILNLNKEVSNIHGIIGQEIIDEITQEYSYTGFYKRFHIIEENIEEISYLTSYTETLASTAYSVSYELNQDVYNNIKPLLDLTYVNSYYNTEKIGQHTTYNVYDKITEYSPELLEYIHEHNNEVFVYNEDTQEYRAVTYNSTFTGDYYIYYPSVPATGIEKEIEDIQNSIEDNSYVLYKLNVETQDTDNLDLTINPKDMSTPNRTIKANLKHSYINAETGEITKGVVTYSGLINSFSYFFTVENLKKI